MVKKVFKQIFLIMLALSISSTMAFSASATSYYAGTNKGDSQTEMGSFATLATTKSYDLGDVTEDNGSDDVYVGFSEITGTYLKNGSAMIANSNGSNYYSWSFSPLGKNFYQKTKCKAKVGAYLRHSDFTDPKAKYSIEVGSFVYHSVGTIDQEYALNGWNYIESNEFDTYESGGYEILYCSKAEVTSSINSNDKTGADAIYVQLSYGY